MFIILNFLAGQFSHGGDHGADAGDIHGPDVDAHLDVDAHVDVDAHADIDLDTHADVDVDAHVDADGPDFHGDHGGDHGGDHAEGHSDTDRYGVLPIADDRATRILKFIVGLLSPTNLSLFITGFGATGWFALKAAPWLGVFTIIPAILVGMAVCNLFKAAIKFIMIRFTSTSHLRSWDVVGQVGEVLTPMTDGCMGEITYVVGSKLYSSTAKPTRAGLTIPRGTKVLIVESNGPTVMVEPFVDSTLEDQNPISKV
ncbi:MAG: hypothetical protein AB7W16_09035 [Candidatus Obscuribacterales bacterium]